MAGAGHSAAGIFSTARSSAFLANSNGVFARHDETGATFSITATAADSSGWAKASAVRAGDLDPVRLAREAAEKATRSAGPRRMEPGKYRVLLEPAAVLDFVGQIFGGLHGDGDRGRAELPDGPDGRTDFRGEYHDSRRRAASAAGRRAVRWRGCAARDVDAVCQWHGRGRCRMEARRRRGPGGRRRDMGCTCRTRRARVWRILWWRAERIRARALLAKLGTGILVTRLWYIREVDPFRKVMTGMTRDGTFLVEDGQIVCGLHNFRFNESVIDVLQRVEAMSATERASGEEAFDMVVPAMLVDGFIVQRSDAVLGTLHVFLLLAAAIEIGSMKQLFIDHKFIESGRGHHADRAAADADARKAADDGCAVGAGRATGQLFDGGAGRRKDPAVVRRAGREFRNRARTRRLWGWRMRSPPTASTS